MNKRISRKTQSLLVVIPYLGFFLVFFMGAYQISKRKNRLYAVLFYLLSLIPIAVFLVIAVLALRFLVLPLENVALVVALSLIVMFVIMLCLAFAVLGIEFCMIKRLTKEEELL